METVTLTYAELAARLGVKDESARKTAQRRRWRKFKGNDGFTRVEVPLEDLPPPEPPPFVPGPTPDQIIARLEGINARLEAETNLLREMLTRADGTLADHKAMIERWQAESMKWQDEAGRWQAELQRVCEERQAEPARRGLLQFWRRPIGKGN